MLGCSAAEVVRQLNAVIDSVNKTFSVVIILMKFGSMSLSELARVVQWGFVQWGFAFSYLSSLAGIATNLSRRQIIP